ncbi:MAG: Trp biosynthesis-associated membrane protein [Pseudonocardia sp.]
MKPARRMLSICAALLAASGALTASSALTWFTAAVPTARRGPVPVTVSGADLEPALGGVALLAVAGVAAALALAGPVRRLLGVLLAAAGGWVGLVVVDRVLAPPSGVEIAELPGAGRDVAVSQATTAPPGDVIMTPAPLLAGLGVALLLAAASGLLLAERGLPRFGARYAARGSRPAVTDPARAAWDDLDAGRDPTEK